MRIVFGILGLLVVVAIVGVLARQQLSAGVAPPVSAGPDGTGARPATPRQQVKQFEQAVQGAVQQARPMPDDDK